MSDPVINALIQSPLVRTLNSIPSKSSSFVHGIPDNIPPFSKTKTIVNYYTGSSSSADTVCRFRIPQNGYLNRAYLKLYVKRNTVGNGVHNVAGDHADAIRSWVDGVGARGALIYPSKAGDGTTTVTLNGSGVISDAWNAARLIDSVAMESHGKRLALLYGDTIISRHMSLPKEERDALGVLTRGFSMGCAAALGQPFDVNSASNQLVNPPNLFPWCFNVQNDSDLGGADNPNGASGGLIASGSTTGNIAILSTGGEHQYGAYAVGIVQPHECAISQAAVVYLPLPFSFMQQLNHNFQTRFVEDLEMVVTKKSIGEIRQAIPGVISVDPQLICLFHTFHDSIENAIRNKNYTRGVPASLLMTDDVLESTLSTSSGISGDTVTFPLRSGHVLTDLYIMHAQSGICGNAPATNTVGGGIVLPGGAPWTPSGGPLPVLGRAHHVSSLYPVSITLQANGQTLWTTNTHESMLDNMPYKLANTSEGPTPRSVFPYDLEVRGTQKEYQGVQVKIAAGSSATAANTQGVSTWGIGAAAVAIDNNTADTRVDRKTFLGGCSLDRWSSLYSKMLYAPLATRIKLGMNDDETYHNGGLALQSLSNPTLTIRFNRNLVVAGTPAPLDYVRVYSTYRAILRIDSDTGVMTRTMDV